MKHNVIQLAIALIVMTLLSFTLADPPTTQSDQPEPPATQQFKAHEIKVTKLKNAKSVLFVCSGCESMEGSKLDVLKLELTKSLGSLRPDQSFNIIFFQKSDASKPLFLAFSTELIPANAHNREKAKAFVQGIDAQGTCSAIPALEEAFRQKPELLFLTNDGSFADPGNNAVAEKISQLNRDSAVAITTILFLSSRKDIDKSAEAEAIMKQIADDNGGVFNEFYANEL